MLQSTIHLPEKDTVSTCKSRIQCYPFDQEIRETTLDEQARKDFRVRGAVRGFHSDDQSDFVGRVEDLDRR